MSDINHVEPQEKTVKDQLIEQLYLNNSQKGVLDSFQEKIISRKLLVFLISTGLLVWSGLDPETWSLIAMMYIGGQSAIDFARVWRHG